MDIDISGIAENNLSKAPQHSKQGAKASDPMLGEGHTLLFDKEVWLQICYLDSDKQLRAVGDREPITVRIMTLGSFPKIAQLRFQFTSEQDLFFSTNFEQSMYELSCVPEHFDIMRASQQLPCKFQQFPTYVMKLMNNLMVESEGQWFDRRRLTGQITIYSQAKAQLVVRKRAAFKQVELLVLDLVSTPLVLRRITETVLQEQIAYRYGCVLDKVKRAEQRLRMINQIIREKNPSLLSQISKQHG